MNSKTPVSNANVELSWSRPATPLGDPGRLIAKGATDINGNIIFSFKAQEKELKAGRYSVAVKKGDEYHEYHEGFYGVKKADSTLNVKTHLASKANLKLVFKDFNPKISTDFFECSPSFKTSNYSGAMWLYKSNGETSNTHFFSTSTAFTSLELSGVTAGNEYTYFRISKSISGNRYSAVDSIYIAKGETKTYTIE
ncbi:hypothetical protein, partial [Pedobacter sp.]